MLAVLRELEAMLRSMAGGVCAACKLANLGEPPLGEASLCRRSKEVLIIPGRQSLHKDGLPPSLPVALRGLGISCTEALRQGRGRLQAGDWATESCMEPLQGLVPFWTVRSS